MGWGKNGGPKKKFFEKKIFSRNFSASFSTTYCRHLGLRRQCPNAAVLSHTVSELWGAKNFRQKNSNPRIGKSGRQILMKFFPTIAFTPAYPDRRQERFKLGRFWEIRPQNLWYEPPLIFWHFRGVPLLKIRWLKRNSVQHVVLRSILFTASIYLNPFSRY
jgi:hypothetical protein